MGSVLNPIDRVRKEGLFHPLIEAGALTHVWLGEARPSKESLANFVMKVFRNSQNDQIAFSPEFTACTACGRTARGLHDQCTYCGSKQIEGITRITGYFTKISSWNKGKLGELRDRYRNEKYFSEDEHRGSRVEGENPPGKSDWLSWVTGLTDQISRFIDPRWTLRTQIFAVKKVNAF